MKHNWLNYKGPTLILLYQKTIQPNPNNLAYTLNEQALLFLGLAPSISIYFIVWGFTLETIISSNGYRFMKWTKISLPKISCFQQVQMTLKFTINYECCVSTFFTGFLYLKNLNSENKWCLNKDLPGLNFCRDWLVIWLFTEYWNLRLCKYFVIDWLSTRGNHLYNPCQENNYSVEARFKIQPTPLETNLSS